MSSIGDLSDDPKHTIKAVCTQTGIRSVTLRAWERRHSLLKPHRSENSYRLYSDRDVALLRWIKARVDEGVPISRAAQELNRMARQGIWPELVVEDEPRQAAIPPLHPAAWYAHQLFQALVKREENVADSLLREASASFDLKSICLEIILPCLYEIGEAWYRGEIRITLEHFASAYLRGKMLSLFQSLPAPRRNAPYLLLGCAPTEQHEIGTLALALLLRRGGNRVEFLGPDVPIDDLVDYISYEKPDMVILSAMLPEAARSLRSLQKKLNALKRPPVFGFGGMAFNLQPALRQEIEGHFLGTSIDQALMQVQETLRQRPAAG